MRGHDHAERPQQRPEYHYDIDGREGDRRSRDPRHPNERRTRTWSPWLVIRYNATDDGRVRPIPAGEVFWASPDIEVQSSAGKGKAVVGEANTLQARVFNLGKADGRPTRVDFYWADPSLGLGPAQMNFIGTKWIEASYHRATPAVCPKPWVPIMANGGHECLFVNCTSDILNDKLQYPFQPQLDRRAAQRNITVITASPGQTVPFWLMVNNVAPMMAKTTIAMRTAHLAVARATMSTMSNQDVVDSAVSFQRGSATGALRQVNEGGAFARSAPHVQSELSERVGVVPSSEGRRSFANLLLNMPAPGGFRRQEHAADAEVGLVLHEVTMDAFEQRRLHLELSVPANAQPGDFIVFHLTQSTADMEVGGYTAVLGV
jgi:hypothetical protein